MLKSNSKFTREWGTREKKDMVPSIAVLSETEKIVTEYVQLETKGKHDYA